ncbi:hypothetical protein [Streptomyces sp. Wh19]|uniref:hypothetical protein n=1 Tax=Streptomyces sp. Wh19 TaxID=3076629 RepID=UPI00295862B2|nr:hypothetical protein [Streptomyces sp. Wh19]MDV9194469.1 hypothetical protein [Streptomyces sp. Wh19]
MRDRELEDVEVLLEEGLLIELAVGGAYFDVGREELAQVGDLFGIRLLDGGEECRFVLTPPGSSRLGPLPLPLPPEMLSSSPGCGVTTGHRTERRPAHASPPPCPWL